MKNRYFLFSFLLLGLFSFATSPLFGQVPGNQQLAQAPSVATHALSQMNDDYAGSGYPWISADGLRLYFSGGGESDAFYFATRTQRNQPFDTPVPLMLQANHDVLSCWLTADELQLWYVERISGNGLSTTLSMAERNSTLEDFGTPKRISVDLTDGFISGPSLTQDGEELFLYNSPGSTNENFLYRLKRTGASEFETIEILEFGTMGIAGSAQLAKDDLKLYVSLENQAGQEYIYIAERKDVHGSFDTQNLRKLDESINISSNKSFQPAVTADEKEIVYTRNPDGMWEGNKLWLAKLDTEKAEEVDSEEELEPVDEYANLDEFLVEEENWDELANTTLEIVSLIEVGEPALEEEAIVLTPEVPVDALEIPRVSLVYPNPSTGIFNFEINLPEEAKNPVLEVFSLDGENHGRWPIESQAALHTIDLSGLSSGTYFYRLVTELGMSDSGKLILVR